ncbi:MAG: fibronectin type III domain-containing protein [Flavobacteriales bacterium]
MYTSTPLVCHGTKRLSAAELVVRGRNHVSTMTGNPAFPHPLPSLAEVAAACDELDHASQVFEFNRGRMDLSTRNLAHERLRRLIICLAGYVQGHCRGDRSIVRSAGFVTKHKRSASMPMAIPGGVRAERADHPGCIDLRWDAVKGRKMYTIQFTDGDPSNEEGWRQLTLTSKNHFTATGLESDRAYTFRILAFGALGYGPPSDISIAKAA